VNVAAFDISVCQNSQIW